MEVTVKTKVKAAAIKVELPVRYGDEDVPFDFPLRKGDVWSAIIDIKTGIVHNWPKDQSADLYMKVCDEGSYHLLDEEYNTIKSIVNDYVPHGIIPGEYGDYVDLKIVEGVITNWKKNPNAKDF